MNTVAIAGASGLVGSRVLERLLERQDVGRIIALGRRSLTGKDPRVVSVVTDLQSPEGMAKELPNEVALGICCLGTTMKQAGSKQAFRAVDRDAVLAFGRAVLTQGARRFVLVSSTGANPGASNFYLRTKGEVESELAALGFQQLTVLRPSFIDDQGARTQYRPAERFGLPIARALFAVVGKTRRLAPIRVDTIARALVGLAFDETTERVRIVESDQLHELGK